MSTRIISLRLPNQLVEEADKIAGANDISRTKLIELLLLKAVSSHERWTDPDYVQQRADLPFHWKGEKQ